MKFISNIQTFLPKNKKFFQDVYEVENRKLGFGHYGDVNKCVHKETGTIRAVKLINRERIGSHSLEENWFFKQIELLSQIDHPCFIRFHEFFEERDYFFLIMDYHREGDLLQKLRSFRKLPEKFVKKVMKNVIMGVSYLHSLRIVHRDLKPENILVTEKDEDVIVKIIDFDTAARLNEVGVVSGLFGTAYYMAPELLQPEYNEKCDMWSVGIIMFNLLTGLMPYGGLSDHKVASNIQKFQINLSMPELSLVSETCKNLLSKLLKKDPKKRIDAETALNDEWFKNSSDSEKTEKILSSIVRSKVKNPVVKDYLISNFSIIKDFEDLDRAFIELDTDHDGIVSFSDMKNLFFMYNSEPVAVEKSDKLLINFREYTEDFLTYSDFLNATINLRNILDEKRISRFLNKRVEKKLSRGFGETTEGENLTRDEESDDWFLDLKDKIDHDMTPQDFRGAVLTKLFVNF